MRVQRCTLFLFGSFSKNAKIGGNEIFCIICEQLFMNNTSQ
jgi:hypothetical protein